jgi:hypothetical protein
VICVNRTNPSVWILEPLLVAHEHSVDCFRWLCKAVEVVIDRVSGSVEDSIAEGLGGTAVERLVYGLVGLADGLADRLADRLVDRVADRLGDRPGDEVVDGLINRLVDGVVKRVAERDTEGFVKRVVE